jgi:dihydroneopterin aldolase
VDRIVIPGLPLRARVGVTDAERAVAQEIELHVELGLDLTAAGAHDDLGRTVDYDAVCEHLGSVVRLTEFRLIEAIAEACARTLLATFPSVDEARVEVRKPAALRSHGVAYAAVEVTRRRG